jgi:hypothetical protein
MWQIYKLIFKIQKKITIFIIMGIKVILTESQMHKIDEQMSQEMQEFGGANLSCTNLNYSALDEYLGNKEAKKIGFETYIERIDDYEIAIKHYRTNIMLVDVTNIITINTKGWRSKTTKDRLNQFLHCRGVQITQKKGEWYLHGSNGDFPYKDGVEVHTDGYVIFPGEKKYNNSNDDLDIDPEHQELYGIQKKEEF